MSSLSLNSCRCSGSVRWRRDRSGLRGEGRKLLTQSTALMGQVGSAEPENLPAGTRTKPPKVP